MNSIKKKVWLYSGENSNEMPLFQVFIGKEAAGGTRDPKGAPGPRRPGGPVRALTCSTHGTESIL